MHRHLVPKFVGAVVLLTALGGGAAYAFTNANSMPSASYSGQGSAPVNGYVVTNISYGLGAANPVVNPGDPQNAITSVTFTLDAPATFAAVDIWGFANPNGTGTPNTLVGGGGGPIPGSNCTAVGLVVTCQVTGTGAGDTVSDPNAAAPYPTPSDITSIDIEASS